MAQDRPTAVELLDAVREFLEKDILPETKGGRAFHTRVAINVLSIVARELREAPAFDAIEREELRALLGHEGKLDELIRELAERIRNGSLDGKRREVMAHVRKTVEAKLKIANPGYLNS
jgi:DNA-binding transcriptional ArsR family regulator